MSITDNQLITFLNSPITCSNCKREIGDGPNKTYFVDMGYEQVCEKCGFCIVDNIEKTLSTEYLFANYSSCLKKKVKYKKINYLNKILKKKEIPHDVRMHINQVFNCFEENYYMIPELKKIKTRYFINYNFIIRKILNTLIKQKKKYRSNCKDVDLKLLKTKFKKIKKRSAKNNIVIYNFLLDKINKFYPSGISLSNDSHI